MPSDARNKPLRVTGFIATRVSDADRGPLSTALADADLVATLIGDDTVLTPTLVYDLGPQPVNTVPPSISGTPAVGA